MTCDPYVFQINCSTTTLQGTNISPKNGILKMIFLFPRWDMFVSWRVTKRWDFHPMSSLPFGSKGARHTFAPLSVFVETPGLWWRVVGRFGEGCKWGEISPPSKSRWWFQILFIFTPKFEEDEPNLTHIFSKGLKPPTRNGLNWPIVDVI